MSDREEKRKGKKKKWARLLSSHASDFHSKYKIAALFKKCCQEAVPNESRARGTYKGHDESAMGRMHNYSFRSKAG
jgi:hypothetical protein